MARHKYRICPLCQQARSYQYGTATPTHCPCGRTLQVIDRNEWFHALVQHAHPSPSAVETRGFDEQGVIAALQTLRAEGSPIAESEAKTIRTYCFLTNQRDVWQRIRTAVYGAALALALLTTTTHAAPASPPAGCAIIGTVSTDEAFPLAFCDDGTYLYADLDGAATHAPGAWVSADGYVTSRDR